MMADPRERRSPAIAGPGFEKSQGNGRALHGHGIPADMLLQRLDRVRRAGKGWIARCPAHDDRSASLSIGEGDDGRVLLHCFAGCAAAGVVAAVGLELGDLFPRRLDAGHLSPDARRRVSMETRTARRWAALSGVLPELAVVEVAACRIVDGRGLSDEDLVRLRLAHQRIHDARLEVAA